MTEKRFTHNGIVIVDHLKKDLIFIDGDENLLDLAEYVDRLEYENEQLKRENQSLLKTISHFDNIVHKDRDYAERMYKENKELKEEIAKFKEWEKHIGDVKREDLDRVFKMSIYEITEAFEYYRKRIKELEE